MLGCTISLRLVCRTALLIRSLMSAVSVSSVSGTLITTRRLACIISSTSNVLPNAPAPIALIGLNRSNFRAMPLLVIGQNSGDVIPSPVLVGSIDGLPTAPLQVRAARGDERPQLGFFHHVGEPVRAEEQIIA